MHCYGSAKNGKLYAAIHRPLLALLCAATFLCAFFSPLKVIAGFGAFALVLLTFRNPRLTILFLAVLIPLEPFLLKFVPDDLYLYARYFSEVLVYVVALSVVAQRVIAWARGEGGPFARGTGAPLAIVVCLLVLDALFSILINQTPFTVALLGVRQIIRFIILFAAVALLPPDRVFVKRLILIVFSLTLFESALGIFQALIGTSADHFLIPEVRKVIGDVQLTTGTNQFWESGQRVFATMGRYDQLGTFLCLTLLLGVGMLYDHRKPLIAILHFRLQAVALFLLGLPALVLTYSRASWFGFALGVFVIGWFVKKDKKILFSTLGLASVFFVYLLFSWGVVSQLIDTPRQTVLERLSESISPERWRGEYYGLGRLYYIVHTPLDIVSRSPLFGVGPGSYGGGAVAALHYTEQYNRAHLPFGIYGTEGYIDNNWFSLWAESGTLGMIFYLWMYLVLFRMALRTYHNSNDPYVKGLAIGFAAVLIAVAFNAFTSTILEIRTVAFYLWLYAGFVYVLGEKERTPSPKSLPL